MKKITRPAFAINYSGGTVTGLVLSEEHGRDLTPTMHPVDDGAPVTDNVKEEAKTLVLSVLVTSFPVDYGPLGTASVTLDPKFYEAPVTDLSSALYKATGAISNRLGGSAAPKYELANAVDDSADLILEAFETLDDIWRSKALCQVVTGLVTYERMILNSVKLARSSETGQAITVSITATQIRTAIAAVGEKIPRKPSGAKKAPQGKANQTTEPTPEKGSVAFKAAKKVIETWTGSGS